MEAIDKGTGVFTTWGVRIQVGKLNYGKLPFTLRRSQILLCQFPQKFVQHFYTRLDEQRFQSVLRWDVVAQK